MSAQKKPPSHSPSNIKAAWRGTAAGQKIFCNARNFNTQSARTQQMHRPDQDKQSWCTLAQFPHKCKHDMLACVAFIALKKLHGIVAGKNEIEAVQVGHLPSRTTHNLAHARLVSWTDQSSKPQTQHQNRHVAKNGHCLFLKAAAAVKQKKPLLHTEWQLYQA